MFVAPRLSSYYLFVSVTIKVILNEEVDVLKEEIF